MSVKYEHLLGRDFEHGKQDCYELIRDFYRDNFDIELTSYARPDNWWNQGLNLYMDNFRSEGFETFDGHPREYQPGDLFLMAIHSEVANHAAIYIGNGMIIHHLYGRRSNRELYKGIWKNWTVAVIRHRLLKDWKFEEATYDLANDPRVARILANAGTQAAAS